MSQQQPGRPLPDYIYRRRRVALLGVLIVLIALIALLIAHPWSGGATKSQGAEVAIPAATQNTSSAAPSYAASTDTPACAKGTVKVQALTDASTYTAGQYPKLTMQVTNTGSAACSLNVGTSQQKFSITSNGETYWLSTDCLTDSSDYPLVLQPNAPVSSEPIIWDRTRSNPGTCQLATRDAVPTGTSYTLTAAVDGFTSDSSTTFTLN